MEHSFVDVVLIEAGKYKIEVIRALREITNTETVLQTLDLTRAKQLVDSTPCIVAANVNLEVGERVRAILENAGATVDLKPA